MRGLSRGDSGASGDLGLFVASRIIQDDFRVGTSQGSLLPVLKQEGTRLELALVVPVDPFRRYIEDLARATGSATFRRPDLLVAGLVLSDSSIACRLTPIEVKYRGKETMSVSAAQEALQQAKAFSELLLGLKQRGQKLVAWQLAFQHLVSSMLGFALRVYSQQRIVSSQAAEWATIHARIAQAILGDELALQIDQRGRLIVLDGSPTSVARDSDADGFEETIIVSRANAGAIVRGEAEAVHVYSGIKSRVKDWMLMPTEELAAATTPVPPTTYSDTPTSPTRFVADESAEITGTTNSEAHSPSPVPTTSPAMHGMLTEHEGQGISLLIGQTVDGFQTDVRRLNLSDTNLTQLNMGVVGDLGTGKTQLLKSLVYQIALSRERNRGIRPNVLIFDYKKDYSSDDFVKAVGARVVKPQHLPINLFDTAGAGDSMTPWLDRFKFFNDVLEKIFSGVGPVQRGQLKTAVRQAYERCTAEGRQPTIYDVHKNYRATLGNKTDSPLSIIDDLVDMQMFSPNQEALSRLVSSWKAS